MKTENARTDRAKPIWPSDYSQAGHKNNYRSCKILPGIPRAAAASYNLQVVASHIHRHTDQLHVAAALDTLLPLDDVTAASCLDVVVAAYGAGMHLLRIQGPFAAVATLDIAATAAAPLDDELLGVA